MSKNGDSISEIQIGNVSNVQSFVVAGRDVDSTITIGGEPVQVDKEPKFDELKQLLAEIQQEMAEIVAQQEVLKEISASTPFTAQGAEAVLKEAVEEVKPDTDPEKAKSVQEKLTETTSSLGKILEGAKTVAKKTGEFSGELNTLTEKLFPLVKKVGVAALWVAKLWL